MAKETTHEDALAKQKEAKKAIAEAKAELKAYFKENKLKSTEDYSKDKKHGKKIARLEKNVEKAETAFAKAKEEAKATKPAATRRTKYEYPPEIDTPQLRKKYRQEQRAKAKKAEKGETDTEAKPKAKKAEPKTKAKKAAPKAKAKKATKTKAKKVTKTKTEQPADD